MAMETTHIRQKRNRYAAAVTSTSQSEISDGVSSTGTQNEECVPKNRTKKRTSENARKVSNRTGLDGAKKYANCANSGTKSAQNETDVNARF